MIAALGRSLPRPRLPELDWRKLRRRLLVVALLGAVLTAGYLLWLRDSSLVAVEEVRITGAEQSASVESALRSAALEQTTLHVDGAALREAVADDPAVRSVSAEPDFPHGLSIAVDMRRPVGYVAAQGVLVADDGVILERSGEAPAGTATIRLDGRKAAGGGRVKGEAMRVTRVLGAAPQPLLAELGEARVDPDFGIVVELGPGLELRFGDPIDAALKWRAAAAVLVDPKFEGAGYLDLSVPERPVAGGLSDGAAADPELAAEVAAAAAEPAAAGGTEADPAVPPPAVEPSEQAPVAAAEPLP
jgi:hypothetical protein